MPEFSPVEKDVLDLVANLIESYHEHLLDARVGVVYRDTGLRVAGRMRVAAASRISPKEKVAGLELDFLIWISKEDWDELSMRHRRALLDHELMHCQRKEFRWTIVGHDIEEFVQIIQRYGLYSDALEKVAEAVQPYLPSIDLSAVRRGGVVTVANEVSPDELQGADAAAVRGLQERGQRLLEEFDKTQTE